MQDWLAMDKTAFEPGQMDLFPASAVPLPADVGEDKLGTPDMFATAE